MEAVEIGEDAVLVSEHRLASLLLRLFADVAIGTPARRQLLALLNPVVALDAALEAFELARRPRRSSFTVHAAIWSKCQTPMPFSIFSSLGPTPQISLRSSPLAALGLACSSLACRRPRAFARLARRRRLGLSELHGLRPSSPRQPARRAATGFGFDRLCGRCRRSRRCVTAAAGARCSRRQAAVAARRA